VGNIKDQPHPLRVTSKRHRSTTVRRFALVAAAAAAVAGVIVGVTITGHKVGRQPTGQLPPGTPKYYVTLNNVPQGGMRYVVRAVVRASSTGTPISSVQLLRSPSVPQPLTITGAASDRAFLITIPPGIPDIAAGLEILRLAPDGHVLHLNRLPKTIWDLGIYGSATGSDVLSPDGTEVLMTIGPPGLCNSCAHGVAMISVTTGVIRKWLLPRGDETAWIPVNWPGNGQGVLLSELDGYRLLDVARPGDSLLASSRPLSRPIIPRDSVTQGGEALLLPDQKTLLAGYVAVRSLPPSANPAAVHATGRIVETSASTGRSRRVLYRLSRVPYQGGWACYPESSGPSQVHVLVWCLNRFGRLDGSHFTPLPGASKDLELNLGAAW
jgi:hypothetical protein